MVVVVVMFSSCRKEASKTIRAGESRRTTLQKLFEPAELRAQFIRAEDEAIRRKDVPERLQLRGDRNRIVHEIERGEEAEWIHDQLRDHDFSMPRTEVVEAIKAVLGFLEEKYEVPFIWTYRRDHTDPYLTRDHMWQIFRLDEKWELMSKRKRQTIDRMERLADSQSVDISEEELRNAEARVEECKSNVDLWRRKLEEARDKVCSS